MKAPDGKERRLYSLNLHVHSVLSPCADLLMTPGNIIQKALEVGIDIIAITDHNSAENIEPALELARNTSLTIIPGMEVETREEVHLLCLFSTLEEVLSLQEIIYELLPAEKNREEYFGPQIKVDGRDQYHKKIERMLLTAADITVEELVKTVVELNGVVIPSHIERVNGIVAQLGMIPPWLELPILEVNSRQGLKTGRAKYKDHKLIYNPDSHRLQDMQPGFELQLKAPVLKEIVTELTR